MAASRGQTLPVGRDSGGPVSLALLLCAACAVAGAWAGPLHAQLPSMLETDAPQVERWQGVHRVDTPPAQGAQPPAPSVWSPPPRMPLEKVNKPADLVPLVEPPPVPARLPVLASTDSPARPLPPTVTTLPPLSAPPPPAAKSIRRTSAVSETMPARVEKSLNVPEPLPTPLPAPRPAPASPKGEHRVKEPEPARPTKQEPQEHVPAAQELPRPEPARPEPESPWRSPLTYALTAAGASLATLFGLLTAYVVFRRQREQPAAPCVRVEFINLPGQAVTTAPAGVVVVNETTAAPPSALPPADNPADPVPAGQAVIREETLLSEEEKTFELGPTYEEEQRLLAQAVHQAEEAALRQLFEQNLALRRELSEHQPDLA